MSDKMANVVSVVFTLAADVAIVLLYKRYLDKK